MTDLKGTPGGEGGKVNSYYDDMGDGTFAERVSAVMRGWDSTDGQAYKLPVDHTTGALLVKATLSAGTIDIGLVDQGTGGSSAWKVSDAALPAGLTVTSTRLLVDGSGVTQPVSGSLSILGTVPVSGSLTTSGTVTANIGSTNGLALDATLTGGSMQIQGTAASAATDAGNPVKVGARVNTSVQTFTNGQRADLQADTKGSLKVTLMTPDNLGNPGLPLYGGSIQDAQNPGSQQTLGTFAMTMTYNGSTWDRMRSAGVGDGAASTGLQAHVPYVFNGTTFDRQYGDKTSGAYVQTKAEVATAAAAAALPSVVKTVGGYDGALVRPLLTDARGAQLLAAQDDIVFELKKHTAALMLLVSQFTGDIDLEGMVA